MTTNTNKITILVSDTANAGGSEIQVTVDRGTVISAVLAEAGITVREGQTINLAGLPVSPDTPVVEEGSMATVTRNTKAA